jgi:hypothetical protein
MANLLPSPGWTFEAEAALPVGNRKIGTVSRCGKGIGEFESRETRERRVQPGRAFIGGVVAML